MKIAIMQPYFLPYIGYFQLINSVDKFVIYDDVQFTKKGWINRNSVFTERGEWKFSIACKAFKETSRISEVLIASEYNRAKFIKRIENEFSSLDNFNNEGFELVKSIISFTEENLFKYIYNSVIKTSDYLGIGKDKFVVSSHLGDFSKYKGKEKVLRICGEMGATTYINPVSGSHLYDESSFRSKRIELKFLTPELQDLNQNRKSASILQDVLILQKSRIIQQLAQGVVK